MLYQKPTLSIQEQITKLKNKGLQISDEQLAAQYLQKISYYRFRAYTYPFQDNNQHISKLQKEINRSDETFIKHYKNKYTIPTEPPCWMSLEVSSFGSLSSFFENLKAHSEKKQITNFFGLKSAKILENWMHYFSHIRNICAHHSRLWKRRPAIRIMLPKKTLYNFIENKNVYPHKIYPSVCAMIYVLNIIEPSHHFVNDLKKLIHQAPFPVKQIKEMGFPKKWENEKFWK